MIRSHPLQATVQWHFGPDALLDHPVNEPMASNGTAAGARTASSATESRPADPFATEP